MNEGITITGKIHLRNGPRGRRRIRRGEMPKPSNGGRTQRITRLMALAIHYDDLIREGAVRDYAEIASLGYVTRARMSQIMSLLNLATDIQEELLVLSKTTNGREPS